MDKMMFNMTNSLFHPRVKIKLLQHTAQNVIIIFQFLIQYSGVHTAQLRLFCITVFVFGDIPGDVYLISDSSFVMKINTKTVYQVTLGVMVTATLF